MYISNPKYNPNDPNSQRYIQVPDGPMSVAPNSSTLPVSTPKPATTTPATSPTTPTAPATPSLNTTLPMNLLQVNTNTTTKTSTPVAPQGSPANPTSTVGNLNYIPGLSEQQKSGIQTLLGSGRAFTETDAKNYAYATGQTNWQQFVGKNPGPNNAAPESTGPATYNDNNPYKFDITGNGGSTGGGQGGPNTYDNPNGSTDPNAIPQNLSDEPNQNNPGGMSDKALAEAAGKANLSVSDFVDLANKANPQTLDQQNEIRNKLGIPGLVDKAFSNPSQTTTEKYKELYDLSGLSDLKTKIANIDDGINKKRRDLLTAIGELQDNPWISQSTRSGRLKNLQTLAYADIQNSLDARQQAMTLYDKGVSQVEEGVNRFVNDNKAEQGLTAEKLNYLLNEAERQQKVAVETGNKQNLRYLPDFLTAKAESGKQYNSGSVQEYQFYSDQEKKAGRTPLSYNDYQNLDANRKARAAGGGPASLLTPTQYADAARKGYITENQLSLYANIVASGQDAPNIKVPTESQGQALGFFDRTRTSNDTLSKLANEFNGILAQGGKLPNFLKSANRQVFDQAEQNFINATLRRESGATIQPSEFAVARQQYIPQPGDTAAVLEAKSQNRMSVINSLRVQAGNFADQLPQQPMDLQTYYRSNPAQQAGIDRLVKEGRSDADILQILGIGQNQGFSQPPSTGVKGSLAVPDNRRNPSKVILGYDFTNYATDPNWGNGVQRIISKIPAITNAAQVGSYIAQVAPKSPLVDHADAIVRIAQEKGIAPQLLLAIMQQESNFGTLGRAAFTHNPANVGNVDSGANVDWGNWEKGVLALANNIAKRTIA